MKQTTKRIVTGGVGLVAAVSLIGATTMGTVNARGDKPDWSKNKQGEQWLGDRVQAYFDLNAALHEHATLGLNALKTTALQTPDAEAAKKALENNNGIIADNVEILYPGTHDAFVELWTNHIASYEKYLAAEQAGDQAGKEAALQELNEFAKQADELLSKKMRIQNDDKHDDNDSNMSRSLEEQLKMHNTHTVVAIDQLVAGDYEGMYATAHEAYNHMEMVARSMGMSWYGGMSKWHHKH
jgi:hypothetical protein